MKTNKMEAWPMSKLVVSMSWPLMLSLLIQSLYNIVDSIFVSRLSEDALTATSLAFPMQILMISVGVGTSVGVNAVLSRSLGEKNTKKTSNIATTGILLALAATIVFTLFGLTCVAQFVSLFTSDATIGAACTQYLFICMVMCVGNFLATMYQRFLQAVGNTFDSMISLVSGAVINLIFDPLFIFGLWGFPALGIRGAAIATVLGQCVSAAVAIALNHAHNPTVKPIINGYRPECAIFADIYLVGLPTIVTQAMGSVMVSSFNAILMPFSSTAVAFFGIYYKLQNFLFMPMNGLGQALIPIIGFNYGAKNTVRIKNSLRISLPAAICIALAMSAVFMIFPSALLGAFNPSAELLAIGIPALRIIAPTFALASVSMILGYAMSGLGVGLVNMLATVIRQFAVLIPLAYLFARYFGIDAVWFSLLVAEIIAMMYAIFHSRRILKTKEII